MVSDTAFGCLAMQYVLLLYVPQRLFAWLLPVCGLVGTGLVDDCSSGRAQAYLYQIGASGFTQRSNVLTKGPKKGCCVPLQAAH